MGLFLGIKKMGKIDIKMYFIILAILLVLLIAAKPVFLAVKAIITSLI